MSILHFKILFFCVYLFVIFRTQYTLSVMFYRRIFSFNEYRRLHTLIDSTEDARYSFVVGALLAAVKYGNDYDRLVSFLFSL